MGNRELDLVKQFSEETGLCPQGTSLKNCMDFAIVIMTMEKDSKMSRPTVRNCQRYAEGKVSQSHKISHGTFYNDKFLNAMMNWYIEKRNAGKEVNDDPKTVKNLTEKVRKRDKQIKALLATQQSFDSVSAALGKAAANAVRNNILFKRAMSLLKNLGKDFEIDMFVSPEEVHDLSTAILKEWLDEDAFHVLLGQKTTENVDEQ